MTDSLTDTRKLNVEVVIDPDSGKGPPEVALKIKSGQPLPLHPTGWKGFSGTAIFVEDFLVGVVVSTAKAADGLLYGCEIARLFQDQKFREALKNSGCSVPTTAALPTVLGEASLRFSKLAVYPLPKISEVDCYNLLGVSKSDYVDRYQARGERPPYIPRDIDDKLTEALKNKDFLLLVGPSKAGKTRTAYEALVKLAPSTPVVVPFMSEDLAKIVEELRSSAYQTAKSVLWLNDLERFLSKGSLNLGVVETALHELGMQIVATMRNREFLGFKKSDSEIARDAQQVLEQAEIIRLEDCMTPQEKERALAIYPDLPLGHGLGESFIAGRELRQRYEHGESPMIAVVRATNDWRRTGLTAPIRRADLFCLFKQHFEHLEPSRDATEEIFRAALDDAREPVARYSALLNQQHGAQGEEGYFVGDYVSDYLENQCYQIVDQAWELALDRIQSGPDCIAVGAAAYGRERADIAKKAWVLGVGHSSAACAYSLGHVLEEQGRLDEAEAAYREAIRINPQHAQAHVNLGVVLRALGRSAETNAALREAIRINPLVVEAHVNLGILLEEQSRSDEAEAAYREAIRVNSHFAKAHFNLGVLLKKQGRPAEAEAAYREAIRIDPQYAYAYDALDEVLEEQGRTAEMETTYREAIRINPQYAYAYRALGYTLKKQGRLEEAEAAYREAIRIDPQYAQAQFSLGYMLGEQGRLVEAEAAHREAIRIDPQYAYAYRALGYTLKKQGRLEEAEAAYREAIRIDPQYAQAYVNLGVMLEEQGRLEEAEAAYREAVRIDPEDEYAQRDLGDVLAEQGRLDEAAAAYQEAIRIDPRYVQAKRALANVLVKRVMGLTGE